MSSPQVVLASAFTGSEIAYSPPKTNASGGKSININNAKTKKYLMLSTPLMLTWGLNENDFDGKRSYDLSLQFPSENYPNPEASSFLKGLVEMENKIKADAVTNSKEWFNKPKMTPEVVDALWTPMLRYKKDPESGEPDLTSAPTLRIKVPFYDGEWKVEIYDVEERLLYATPDILAKHSMSEPVGTPMQLVPKQTNVALVVQCGGIWFAGGKFGVTWKLMQCVVKPKASLDRAKCLVQMSSADKDALSKQEDRDDDEEPAQVSTVVADSDDEDEAPHVESEQVSTQAEEVKEVAATPAVVKKKRVVKKKTAGD